LLDFGSSQQWPWRLLVFWDVTLHSLAKITVLPEVHAVVPFIYCACCLLGLFSIPENGARMFLWNVSKLLPDYLATHIKISIIWYKCSENFESPQFICGKRSTKCLKWQKVNHVVYKMLQNVCNSVTWKWSKKKKKKTIP
jgi:hypothetical protein